MTSWSDESLGADTSWSGESPPSTTYTSADTYVEEGYVDDGYVGTGGADQTGILTEWTDESL